MPSINTLRAGAPRYVALAETLIHDIDTGKYQVGGMLPPELELSEQYGVSRHTVREAIRRLADMGLIARRQGIGTRINAKSTQPRYVASLTSISDLFQYAKETRLRVLAERWVTADAQLAATLRCKSGQSWFKLETCRYLIGGGEPISYTEIYLPPTYQGISAHIDDQSVSVYSLIEQHYGQRILEVQQEVGAIAIPARVAKLLAVRSRSPGLHVLRYYLGAGDRMISLSMNIYPENRFKFSTRWRLEWERHS